MMFSLNPKLLFNSTVNLKFKDIKTALYDAMERGGAGNVTNKCNNIKFRKIKMAEADFLKRRLQL